MTRQVLRLYSSQNNLWSFALQNDFIQALLYTFLYEIHGLQKYQVNTHKYLGRYCLGFHIEL